MRRKPDNGPSAKYLRVRPPADIVLAEMNAVGTAARAISTRSLIMIVTPASAHGDGINGCLVKTRACRSRFFAKLDQLSLRRR